MDGHFLAWREQQGIRLLRNWFTTLADAKGEDRAPAV
jgi:hypothetical protein